MFAKAIAAVAAAVLLSGSALAQQAVPALGIESGVSSYPFDLTQVSLSSSRWKENEGRTLSYLKDVDVGRMLYNFRANHKLSTQDAATNGGWDAPDFPFRTHFQGHFLTAWSYCWAALHDEECKSRAESFVEELKKCQDNNAAANYTEGYLSGFPESEFDLLEARTLSNGNVPYYALHKTLAGLLDVWRHVGSDVAKEVLLAFAGWVDWRTGRLSYDQMQNMMDTEFGGMNEVMADIWHQTGDERWLDVATRFHHAEVFIPLANDVDALSGYHANTQVPKWIGAAKEYKATGNTTLFDIAKNAWDMTVYHHSYSIGGNSQAEHFHGPDEIAGYLTYDTCEACNTYNMLKLTRELYVTDPDNTEYFDFYENAVLNHLLGQQDPSSQHGHITYFTSLNPGGYRGVGPAWNPSGEAWSSDYNAFWCCQGTALETNTKFTDSIYFYSEEVLYVNLFTPSVLAWGDMGVTITQSTDFPKSDTTTLRVDGSGEFTLAIRIPAWVSASPSIAINGETVSVDAATGSYAKISRTWSSGDEVVIILPMDLYLIPANDDSSLAAVGYGPAILSGNYGSEELDAAPTLDLSSIVRPEDGEFLTFEAKSGSDTVTLSAFYEAVDYNYVVYWSYEGQLASVPSTGDDGEEEPSATSSAAEPTATTECAGLYRQCGGNGYNGVTCCVEGATCHVWNEWYSQCISSS